MLRFKEKSCQLHVNKKEQDSQGSQKLNSLKSLKIKCILRPSPLPFKTQKCAKKISETAFLSNCSCQNRKERPNRSTNYRFMA